MPLHLQFWLAARQLLRPLVLIIGMLGSIAGGWPPPAAASSAGTGPIDIGAIDRQIEAQIKKHGLPGVALAITQGDQIVYMRGYGTAGGQQMLTPQTPMYIGSASKSFTALAIAQLVEQGKIELDAPVQRYIPWFRVADPAASAMMTVRHFVHHASGLSEAGFNVLLPDTATAEQAVRALKDAQLTAPVGARSQYFNLNYTVLALVIEAASGQPYATYITEQIFVPLHMTHSYTTIEAAQADRMAQGYTRFFGFALPKTDAGHTYELSNGYLISTTEDMAQFVIALNNQGVSETTQLLSPAGLRSVSTPRQQEGFAYAMGWFVDDLHGLPRIHHGGATATFKTFMQRYPTRNLGLVLMINEGYLLDHTISAEQLFQGVEQLALGLGQPDPGAGIAVPVLGWAMLVLVLALLGFQCWQFWRLRSWYQHANRMSPVQLAKDIGLNFLIPTAILAVIIWQVAGLFGDRFNLRYQASMLFRELPDIGILMLVSTVPDYLQGLIKIGWLIRAARQRPTARAHAASAPHAG